MATEHAERTVVQSTQPMTQAEALALAEKVEAWTATLEPKEQALLGEVFRRAGGEESGDVAGYCSFCRGVTTVWFTTLNAVDATFSSGGGSTFANDRGPKY